VKIKQTVKPVYKGHSREPENVVFMNSGSLYTKLYVLNNAEIKIFYI
jgi:hypothetical protein